MNKEKKSLMCTKQSLDDFLVCFLKARKIQGTFFLFLLESKELSGKLAKLNKFSQKCFKL